MSARYILTCDECGEAYGGGEIYSTLEGAREDAASEGWQTRGGLDGCDTCWPKSDDQLLREVQS